jgi:hypothetical protein
MTNHLYYGDNLQVLREHIATESVDLTYLTTHQFFANFYADLMFR